MHLTPGNAPQQLPRGIEPRVGWGMLPPSAAWLGLGALRFPQADRLAMSDQPVAVEDPAQWPAPRIQDPRTLDAGRLLDYGAPAPAMVVEYAPMPYRPTEAPGHLQRVFAMGGRHAYVGAP